MMNVFLKGIHIEFFLTIIKIEFNSSIHKNTLLVVRVVYKYAYTGSM